MAVWRSISRGHPCSAASRMSLRSTQSQSRSRGAYSVFQSTDAVHDRGQLVLVEVPGSVLGPLRDLQVAQQRLVRHVVPAPGEHVAEDRVACPGLGGSTASGVGLEPAKISQRAELLKHQQPEDQP